MVTDDDLQAMKQVTLQVHLDGTWHDLADITFDDPAGGVLKGACLAYRQDYLFDHAIETTRGVPVIDRRAASVTCPIGLDTLTTKHWPAFLVDLLPQGGARRAIARQLGFERPDLPQVELPVMLRAAGASVGNLRIAEAHAAEQARLADMSCPPLTDDDIAARSEALVDVISRFCPHWASGASAQGEWPKALMTRNQDGIWLPDPLVPDEEAIEHVIVKLLRTSRERDMLILSSEAAYLEVARWFGIDVAAPLGWHEAGTLVIPRFDRERTAEGLLLRHGQESVFSALGVADNAKLLHHEDVVAMLKAFSGCPDHDVADYLRRDLLNLVMGNPDNHGRNTALRKHAQGGVRLAPLFDFAPMALADDSPARGMRWRCLRGRDIEPDWWIICSAIAADADEAQGYADVLGSCIDKIALLPRVCRDMGLHGDVSALVERRLPTVLRGLDRLAGRPGISGCAP